jgi:predicted Zn-dependent protease
MFFRNLLISIYIALQLSFVVGCASSSHNRPRDNASAESLALLHGYDIISSRAADAVLSELSSKLQVSLDRASETDLEMPQIFLVRSPICLALSQDGILLISDHLLVNLDHVAELAFIVAHETAHTVLQHDAHNSSTGYKHDMEIEADHVGLGLVALAGYNPWYSIDALIKAYSCNYWASTKSHPSLQARSDAMAKDLMSLGVGDNSTDFGNRDFKKLKWLIANQKI